MCTSIIPSHQNLKYVKQAKISENFTETATFGLGSTTTETFHLAGNSEQVNM
jgi:hypothetical protein